jgi:MFS family permease
MGLTDLEMGYVFSVFALAYGLFEIPMGLLGDRYGQRRLMARIVASWSIFTAVTGLMRSFWPLVATRFLFGAAEAGAFPTLARGLARWFPQADRGRANGVMWMGARSGGALAPRLAAALIARLGWRLTFAVFGAVGVICCVVFWRVYRDDPATHPGVSKAELEHVRHGEAAGPGSRDDKYYRSFMEGRLGLPPAGVLRRGPSQLYWTRSAYRKQRRRRNKGSCGY